MKMESTPTSAKKLQKDSRKKLRRTRELIFLNASQNEDLLNTPRELRSTLKKKNKNFLPKIDDIVDDNKTSSDSSANKPKKLSRKAAEKSVEDEIVDKYFDFTNPDDSKREESQKTESNFTSNSTDVSEENVSGIFKRRIVRAKRHFKVQETGAVARTSPLRTVQTSEKTGNSDCQNVEEQEQKTADNHKPRFSTGSPKKVQEKCQTTELDSTETSRKIDSPDVQSAQNQEQTIPLVLSTGSPKNDCNTSGTAPQIAQNDGPVKARKSREFKRDSTFVLEKPVSKKRRNTDISFLTPCTNIFDSNKSVVQNPKNKKRKTDELDSAVDNVNSLQAAAEEVQQTENVVQEKLTPSASPQRRDSLTSCDKLLILRKTIFPSTENAKIEIGPKSDPEKDLPESSSDEAAPKNTSNNKNRRTYTSEDQVTEISRSKSQSQKELRKSLVAGSADGGTSGSRKRRTYELKDSTTDISILKSESQKGLGKSPLIVKNTPGSRKRRTYELDDSVTDVEILKSESQKDSRESSAIASSDNAPDTEADTPGTCDLKNSVTEIPHTKSESHKDLRKSLLIESVAKNSPGRRKRRTYELDDSVTDVEILKSQSEKDSRKSLVAESADKGKTQREKRRTYELEDSLNDIGRLKSDAQKDSSKSSTMESANENTSDKHKRRTYELDDSVTEISRLKSESQKDSRKSSATASSNRNTSDDRQHESCDLDDGGAEILCSKSDSKKGLRKSVLIESVVTNTSGSRRRRTYELDDSVTDVEILKSESEKNLRKSEVAESTAKNESQPRKRWTHQPDDGLKDMAHSKSESQKDLRKSVLIESVVENTSGSRRRRTYELDDSVTDVETLKSESEKNSRKSEVAESTAKNKSQPRKRWTHQPDDSLKDMAHSQSESQKDLRKSLLIESVVTNTSGNGRRRTYELDDGVTDVEILKSESEKDSTAKNESQPRKRRTYELNDGLEDIEHSKPELQKDLRKSSATETVAENKSDSQKRRTLLLEDCASEISQVKSESHEDLHKSSLTESANKFDGEKPQITYEIEDSVIEVKVDGAQKDPRRSLAAEFAERSDGFSSDEEGFPNQVKNSRVKSEISEDLPESASETLINDVTIHNSTRSSTESISPIVPETEESSAKNSDEFSKVTTRRRNLNRKMSKSFGGLFDSKPTNFRLDNMSAVSLVDEDLDSNNDLDNSDDAYLMEAKRKLLKLYNLNESNLKGKPIRSVLKSSQQRQSKTPQPRSSTKKVEIDRKSGSLRKMTSTGKKQSKVKVPNFALIHQKAFEKMENIAEYRQRKEERAKFLLSGKKPVSEMKAQSEMSATKPERKTKKQLRFAPDSSQLQEKSPFVPLPSTPLPRKSVLRRFLDENINLNDSSLIGSPIYVDSPSVSQMSQPATPLQRSKIESQDNIMKRKPQNVSFGVTPPAKSKTNVSSQRMRLTPAAQQPKIKSQWGKNSAGLIRIQTPAKSQLQSLPSKMKPNVPGRATPMKSKPQNIPAPIRPESQGLPTPMELSFSGLPLAAPDKSNLPRLPTPVKFKSHNVSAQTKTKPQECPTPIGAQFSGLNPPKLPRLPTPMKSRSHGLPTPTQSKVSGLSSPMKSLNINMVQKFGNSPVASKKPQLSQKNVGLPPSNHQAGNKVSQQHQQPQTGFNRFGFKMPNKNEPKRHSNRMEEMKKIISKKKVMVKNDVAERRDCLKGVRSNRRFELLMKMRNQN